MKHEDELKLQALLDGELSAAEAQEVGESLRGDAVAEALRAELQWTKVAVASGEEAMALPETRDFYWSKIARELGRLEQPVAEKRSWTGASWLRWLTPVSGLAAVAFLMVVAMRPDISALNETENALEESNVYTFQSQAEKLNIIWIQTEANEGFTPAAPDAKIERNDNN